MNDRCIEHSVTIIGAGSVLVIITIDIRGKGLEMDRADNPGSC